LQKKDSVLEETEIDFLFLAICSFIYRRGCAWW